MQFLWVFPILVGAVWSYPRIMPEQMLPAQLLTLPSNATSIRSEISDSFSCEGRDYGYYADVENDCQLFHVCLPMRYQDGRSQMFRWSFICPEETIFNQEIFTCTRSDESIDCVESPRFYDLNRNFGNAELEISGTELPSASSGLEDSEVAVPAEVPQSLARTIPRKGKIA
ncbi:U-scoloptoxin(01)-Cw1a-like [Sitophilus oryzae]|uniref:U-scoloptoxin(01)-Cw1a-like n=1 Tax=Sitophilus oryzae TaxID=7048 RepID=A0A6J2XZ90_SITOR|nr:U-scoloptoxin(01)-Cw1a-like [Sitophilus oryzae]